MADRQAASAAAEAEPPVGDLFSVRQLKATAKRNKVDLTNEGLQVFYEEMQESGWMLFQKPIEKKGIVKALRGWAKYHPEYSVDLEFTELEQMPLKTPLEPEKQKEPELDMNDKVAMATWLKEQYGENVFEECGFSEEEFYNENHENGS